MAWIKTANPQLRRVLLRDPETGDVTVDVTFDEDGRARCRKDEARALASAGYELKHESAGGTASGDEED